MNYIVLDLEWNQCPDGKSNENSELAFEIVELGAVKLDENRKEIGSFHEYVSPTVYRRLHRITRDIINVTMEELDQGDKFNLVAERFFNWCKKGGEYRFATWGSMDLTELQKNCAYFKVNYKFPFPFIYFDLQKLFSICYDDGKSRISLEAATEQMQIEVKDNFHSAITDAQYTAAVFEKMDFEKVKGYVSVDTYVIPKNRKQEYTLVFETYSKFVSRGFADREELLNDSSVRATTCYLCGKTTRKKIRWFTSNQKMCYCLTTCDTHGYIKGRIKVKKTADDLLYATKIMKQTDEAGAKKIRDKQLLARKKRREKRHMKNT